MKYNDYVMKLPNLDKEEKMELQEKINRSEVINYLMGLCLGLLVAVAVAVGIA